MMWVDPANWTTTPEELEAMDKMVQHFEAPLQAAGFKKDRLKAEWCSMKTTYKYYNAGQDAATFWAKSFKHRRPSFPNVCLQVKVVMALGPSNSIVESAFSILNAMLSDRRLSLQHSTMENLLLLKHNGQFIFEAELNVHAVALCVHYATAWEAR
ncbi:hypothetical protein CAPTEDRAFT_214278 [Capitella teleta]|uniref:HAT C-terminal dimerisation domain-containing protein n=1 Tax=Capitella teleta TaxID=283909 RepID=R7VAE4_CAPTE|nr:hypothetical protein CAPTEDRAFT_214278 [Capitella teleta]|eukprot:ELU15584.1 hypothetical protein CAPTEDRAFT_214278 [Capitella teleta]